VASTLAHQENVPLRTVQRSGTLCLGYLPPLSPPAMNVIMLRQLSTR